MSKTLKNLFITLLALLTIIVGSLAFAVPQTARSTSNAYADDTGIILERKTSDDNFSFRKSSVSYDKADFDINGGILVFSLSLDNAIIDGYNGNGLSTGFTQNLTDQVTGTKCPITEARLSITVYKGTEDNQDNVAIAQYDIVSFMRYTQIFKRKLSNRSNLTVAFNDFSLLTSQKGNKDVEDYVRKVALYDEMKQARTPFKTGVGDCVDIFSGDKFGIPFKSQTDGAYLNIGIFNVSVQDSYYLDLTYCVFTGCGSGFNYGKRSNEYIGNIKSENASIVGILNEEQESGALNDKSSSYKDYAQKILDGYSMKTVKVRFLENLEDTPFAVMNEETVEIPIYKNYVILDDVLNSLNRDTLVLKYSSVDSFVKDDDLSNSEKCDVYVAKYRDGIQLSAKTTDTGKNAVYYLDLNLSYREYFGKLVTDGIITENLYKWFYNDILTRQYPNVPELERLEGQESDLYGYFGFIMIPQTNSIEAIWGDLFNKNTTYSGTIHYSMNTSVLSISAYNQLLDKYKYSWLERAWNSVIGSATNYDAKLYMFYVESAEDGDLWIGENGAKDKDDDKGALVGDVSDGISQIGTALGKFFGGNSAIITAIKVVALILVVILIFYVVYKLFLQNRNKNQRR